MKTTNTVTSGTNEAHQLQATRDFLTLVNGSTHQQGTGVCGTNHIDRMAIWEGFCNAWVNGFQCDIKGVTLTFKREVSVSGKTVTYTAPVTMAQYVKLNGTHFGYAAKGNKAYVSIDSGVITLHGGGKSWGYIDNSIVDFYID
jgi:hypothetical protein